MARCGCQACKTHRQVFGPEEGEEDLHALECAALEAVNDAGNLAMLADDAVAAIEVRRKDAARSCTRARAAIHGRPT